MSHILSTTFNLILNFILVTSDILSGVKNIKGISYKLLWKPADLYAELCFCLQLVFILEQLHAITSVPPETPHEKWFQEKFGECCNSTLYPARREAVRKLLLLQSASWAAEVLTLSRCVWFFPAPKSLHLQRPDINIPYSAGSFLLIYPQLIFLT